MTPVSPTGHFWHPPDEPEFSFTCCDWDKLSPEGKAAVREIAEAMANLFADSPLSDSELAEYESSRESIVKARERGERGE
jgi:hypothetical protein